MEQNKYNFKVFDNGVYQNAQTNLITKNYLVSEITDVFNKYSTFPYSKFCIPESKIKELHQLLTNNGIMSFENEILSFLIHAQYIYIEFEEIYKDESIEMFIKEDEEYKILLNMIESYYFSTKNELSSIRFNFLTKSNSVTIKNKEVLTDIFNSICKNLKITRENFQQRKSEIIEDAKIIRPDKGGRVIVTLFIKTLFNYFQKVTTLTENSIFNIIGELLTIAEIDNQLSETTYQYLRNYLIREMKNFS